MHNQSDTILVAKFVVIMLLFGVAMRVFAHFRDSLPIHRPGLVESILLGVLVFAGTLGFFKWIANKHHRDY